MICKKSGNELIELLIENDFLPDLPYKSVQINASISALATATCEFIIDKEFNKKVTEKRG